MIRFNPVKDRLQRSHDTPQMQRSFFILLDPNGQALAQDVSKGPIND